MTACAGALMLAGCGAHVPENPVHTLDDLEGKTIGVQLKTTGDSYASDIEGADVQRFNKGRDAVLALREGTLDAVMLDDAPANVFVKEFGDIMVLDEPYADEEYGIAVGKDNPELLERINEALEKLKTDGTLDAIKEAWILGGETRTAYERKKESYANGTLVMATNAAFPPYEDDVEGEVVGIDVDIMKAICDELDMGLQIEDTAFNSLIASVERKTADVAVAAMTIREDRLEHVNFSEPYMQAKQVIIVRSK